MNPFIYHNPVKVIFGEGQLEKLSREISEYVREGETMMMVYGGGSIKKNGTYDRVRTQIDKANVKVIEFGGITANPEYEILMEAVALAKRAGVKFLLAVGGGSVIDGTKFISAAVHFEGDCWSIVQKAAPVKTTLPLGTVLTLPATGSEMNCIAVISRRATGEKMGFRTPVVFPKFSILDPTVTLSLDQRQIGNGVVDAFVHVLEQYLTYDQRTPIQDGFAATILKTLIEVGPITYRDSTNLEARTTMMWCATNGLNGYIGVGVNQDWSTHSIGHEFTVLLNLDHARALAASLIHALRIRKDEKRSKLLHFARNVWSIGSSVNDTEAIDLAINKTEMLFKSLGLPTDLKSYNPPVDFSKTVVANLKRKGFLPLGENRNIDEVLLRDILDAALK